MDGINKSVSSLTFDNDDNIYAGVWTGSYQSPSNGEVYKCLATNNFFTLVQKNLPAIWHLKTKDSEPFIELEY